MKSRSELFKSRTYWIDRIQNDIFRALNDYKEKEGLSSNTELAEKLGFSKGYISQVMNGNFNFTSNFHLPSSQLSILTKIKKLAHDLKEIKELKIFTLFCIHKGGNKLKLRVFEVVSLLFSGFPNTIHKSD